MEEIVVISSTNRPNSNTLMVSKIYQDILKSKNVDVKILDFCALPENIAFGEVYGKRSEAYTSLIDKYIVNSKKFIFVVPEYNGSYPGILKLFLDSVNPKMWEDKDACLVGVSAGRAGNLRGIDHLTSVLNYLKMHVYYNKLPISTVDKIMNAEGKFISEDVLKTCELQIEGFLKY
ncbi:MAG: NAD(P)H-dependent oxidoreductase [Bacteroidota bacterium]|nr:NAD(P)H-dependent oxidoreductase [Bacteroidota bacterium]MDP3147300.1 NAD(P)H-dependent oxidoreductase [Bacteroidota bacterium]MDP3557326.1 NAD(P)H-dependent oxidoreductase [Bacteroidota bacterium]